MRVAVVDVGSNTIRLLVAEPNGRGVKSVRERKAIVGLGAEVALSGSIPPAKIEEASAAVAAFTAEARELGCVRLSVVVASPGRQAGNASELVARLDRAAGQRVQVLSRDEEGQLAWEGALSRFEGFDGSVAVCDVGGGSTQIAFGLAGHEPVWLRSIDVGSLRLTARLVRDDPPGKKAIAAAAAEVQRELDGHPVPLPMRALAVGGTARAVRKLVGKSLGESELSKAIRVLAKEPNAAVAADFGIDPLRARTMAAGAVVLAELQRRLGVPLEVVPAGLREGVALSLVAQQSAA
jgi:exopolyphosphatase/guanosine-5'-triphosphate,3'-diphosphate pyrophosphatase